MRRPEIAFPFPAEWKANPNGQAGRDTVHFSHVLDYRGSGLWVAESGMPMLILLIMLSILLHLSQLRSLHFFISFYCVISTIYYIPNDERIDMI